MHPLMKLCLAPGDGSGIKKPTQFFMMPPVNGEGGKIRAAFDCKTPEFTSFQAWMTSDGWAFELGMPLGTLDIISPAGIFRFDIICNVKSPVAGQNLLRLPVWGMIFNHADANRLARFTITPQWLPPSA